MDTSSEEWRLECEARQVLQWDKTKRIEYYAMVAEHRGKASARALRDAVNAQWRHRQEMQQSDPFAS